ncbi:MAG: hypothetical protein ACRD0K_24810 [Egibacteraceae bacterium]
MTVRVEQRLLHDPGEMGGAAPGAQVGCDGAADPHAAGVRADHDGVQRARDAEAGGARSYGRLVEQRAQPADLGLQRACQRLARVTVEQIAAALQRARGAFDRQQLRGGLVRALLLRRAEITGHHLGREASGPRGQHPLAPRGEHLLDVTVTSQPSQQQRDRAQHIERR